MQQLLLADEEIGLRRVRRPHLERAGYAVVTVGDGFAGLRAISAGRFDVVVADIGMPRVDGLELIGCARRRLAGARIGADSGRAYGLRPDQLIRSAATAGADACLCTPVRTEALIAAIASGSVSRLDRSAPDQGTDIASTAA